MMQAATWLRWAFAAEDAFDPAWWAHRRPFGTRVRNTTDREADRVPATHSPASAKNSHARPNVSLRYGPRSSPAPLHMRDRNGGTQSWLVLSDPLAEAGIQASEDDSAGCLDSVEDAGATADLGTVSLKVLGGLPEYQYLGRGTYTCAGWRYGAGGRRTARRKQCAYE